MTDPAIAEARRRVEVYFDLSGPQTDIFLAGVGEMMARELGEGTKVLLHDPSKGTFHELLLDKYARQIRAAKPRKA